MTKPFLFSTENVLELAIKARDGDHAAREYLTCEMVRRIAVMEPDVLLDLFRSHIHEVTVLANSMGLSRGDSNKAFEDCWTRAGKGDAFQLLKARQFMLSTAINATHALWLTMNEQPHISIGGPKAGPPENKLRVTPS